MGMRWRKDLRRTAARQRCQIDHYVVAVALLVEVKLHLLTRHHLLGIGQPGFEFGAIPHVGRRLLSFRIEMVRGLACWAAHHVRYAGPARLAGRRGHGQQGVFMKMRQRQIVSGPEMGTPAWCPWIRSNP